MTPSLEQPNAHASPAPGSTTRPRLPQTDRAPWRRVQAVVRGLGGCAASHVEGTGTVSAFLATLADRGLGGCAASHVEGTGTVSAFLATLADRPWGVVTVPALVPCARW